MSNADWHARARAVLPAGGFGNFPPEFVIARGQGSHVWDEDGREFIDYLIGSGPMMLGHGHPEVVEAVERQLKDGMTFFANNARGIELAEQIVADMACGEQVRFVSTGGEADMYAMRLARAHTGRDLILKFEGGYHGMSDAALMSLFPEMRLNFPSAEPSSAGISDAVRSSTLIAPYNDLDATLSIIAEHADRIAGIIVEPLQRIVPPVPGFLQGLRDAATKHGIVLIFDEVVTGYRLAYGGGQAAYGVTPDLCTLGKVIGGGFPLAAIAGSAGIMAHFDKGLVGSEGFTIQIGTLSGNPVAAVAGLRTMELLRAPGVYEGIEARGKRLMDAARNAFAKAGVPIQVVGAPCLFDLVFTDKQVRDFRDTASGNKARAARYNAALRERGIFKSDSKIYVGACHTDADIDATVTAIEEAAAVVAADG